MGGQGHERPHKNPAPDTRGELFEPRRVTRRIYPRSLSPEQGPPPLPPRYLSICPKVAYMQGKQWDR